MVDRRGAILLVFAFLLASMLGGSGPADASAPVAPAGLFISHGPSGGFVTDIRFDPVDPSVAFAATFGAGLFRSGDGGRSWAMSFAGSGSGYAEQVAISPSDDRVLYSTWFYDGVFRSDDGGRTWVDRTRGMGGQGNFGSVAVDPTDPDRVFVAKSGGYTRRSLDGGLSWETMEGLDSIRVDSVVVASDEDSTVYASAYSDGTFRSTDGGDSWIHVDDGIRGSLVTIDPMNSDVVYLLGDDGLFRSDDRAETWALVGEALAGLVVYDLTIDPAHPDELYAATGEAGVLRSTDRGATWVSLHSPGPTSRAVAVGGNGSTVVFGNLSGVFRRDRLAGRWEESDLGLSGTSIVSMAVAPSDPSIVYAGTTEAGPYRSGDGGGTWHRIGSGLSDVAVTQIAVDPTDPATVYVGVEDYPRGSQLYRSEDGGENWVLSQTGIDIDTLTGLAVDPIDSAVLFASDRSSGFYRSLDSGRSWTSIGELDDADLIGLSVDPTDDQVLYTWSDSSVYQSFDQGVTWLEVVTGGVYVQALAVDPLDPSLLYLADDVGLWRSVDRGLTWQQLTNNGLNHVLPSSLAIDPSRPQVLYVGAQVSFGWRSGLYRSVDGGTTFNLWARGLPERTVLALAVSPIDGTVYAGLESGAVYVSTPA